MNYDLEDQVESMLRNSWCAKKYYTQMDRFGDWAVTTTIDPPSMRAPVAHVCYSPREAKFITIQGQKTLNISQPFKSQQLGFKEISTKTIS